MPEATALPPDELLAKLAEKADGIGMLVMALDSMEEPSTQRDTTAIDDGALACGTELDRMAIDEEAIACDLDVEIAKARQEYEKASLKLERDCAQYKRDLQAHRQALMRRCADLELEPD